MLQPLQHLIAMRLTFARHDDAGEKGDDGERHQQRRKDCRDHRCRQRTDVVTRAAGQQHQRDECENQRAGRTEDCRRDLTGGGDCRVGARHPAPQESRNVFHHHDRVVHQQAECDHKSDDGQLVECETGAVQQHRANGQRQRNRDHHHAGRAQSEWQQRDQHERDRDREVFLQPAEPVLHVLRLIE